MKTLIITKVPRIIKNKDRLENELNIKIEINGKEIKIEGKPEEEYLAEKVLEALDFGFPLQEALSIQKEDLFFETINIKDYTTQKNFERIRGRVIGKEGKALKTISSLGNCSIEILGNKIGIIGDSENIKRVEEACKLLIKGTKHGNVYAYLESHKPEPIYDLGLKEAKKTRKKKKQ